MRKRRSNELAVAAWRGVAALALVGCAPAPESADPCTPNPCHAPEHRCLGNTLQRFADLGECQVQAGEAECHYALQETIDCGVQSGRCSPSLAACVECLGDAECGEEICEAGACVAGCRDDRFESNDARAQATAIGASEESSLWLCESDSDWFTFDAAEGELISVVAFYDGEGPLTLTVLDSNEAEVAQTTGAEGVAVVRDQLVPPGAAGAYALHIARAASASASPRLDYRVRVLVGEALAACDPNPCTGAAPACDGNARVHFDAPGTCTDSGAGPECTYAETLREPCDALTCQAGECVDCASASCVFTVDFCRLHYPALLALDPGASGATYARLYIAGLTDRSTFNDPMAAVRGEVGYGPPGSDPDSWSTWLPAVPTPDYDGSAALPLPEPNNDEYTALLVAPLVASDYDVAYRFSGDDGATWTICDRDSGVDGEDGSENGYQSANASVLTVDDPCDPNPCTDPPLPVCEGNEVVTRANPGVCVANGGTPTCTYPELTRDDCGPSWCVAGACESFRPASVGDLVITEIALNPEAVDDALGEWFEIESVAGVDVGLADVLVESAAATVALGASLVLAPGERIVVGVNDDLGSNGGVAVDVEVLFELADGPGRLALNHGALLIDEVAWDDGSDFAWRAGASLSLRPDTIDAALNDDGASWCFAVDRMGPSGDFGTPGLANRDCGTWPVDFCRLQHPAAHAGDPGASVEVYGRLYIAALTAASSTNDPDAAVLMEAGVGPDGTVPDLGWQWFAAVPTPGYDGATAPAPEPNNDEYVGTVELPAFGGAYDLAVRFSGDSGSTWTLCDRNFGFQNDGSEDGYQAERSGELSVASRPPFISEYIEANADDQGLELFNPSAFDYGLGGCELRLYADGAASPTSSIPLGALTLPSKASAVWCTAAADPLMLARCDSPVASLFDGNDAVELWCPWATLDVFGQIGVDPGATGWGGVTAEHTLRRACDVSEGDPDGSDAFVPADAWQITVGGVVDDLGTHCGF